MEIWKDVVGYEEIYQVSNFGNVKSLSRLKMHLGMHPIKTKEKILKQTIDAYGYLIVDLYKDSFRKSRKVHQLVAESFLNHKPNGYKLIVNHKNFIRNDNNINNLEILTFRENTNKKHLKSSSIYTGVHWSKTDKKWISRIFINGLSKNLGCFNLEIDAHNAYQKELQKINI